MSFTSETNLINFDSRKVGIEFELPLVHDDGSNIDKDVLQKLWKSFVSRGWIGSVDTVSRDIHAVSKEVAGCQIILTTDIGWSEFEIVFPPLDTVSDVEGLFQAVLREIMPVILSQSLRLLSIGLVPGQIHTGDAYRTSKQFYQIVDYFYLFNSAIATAAHQTNVSVRIDEVTDAVNELSVVSGLLLSLTANSSISEFRVLPWRSWRHVLFSKFFATNAFPKLDKIVHKIHDHPFSSLADCLGYFLKAEPHMIVPPMRDGSFVLLDKKVTWLEYLKGGKWMGTSLRGERLEVIPGPEDINTAMHNQWFATNVHISVDPAVCSLPDFINALDDDRLETYLDGKLTNCYVEYRELPAPPPGEECISAALVLGLVENILELQKLRKQFNWDEWKRLLDDVAVIGMDAKIGNIVCRKLLPDLLDISKRGLKRRGFGEEKYLEKLYERVKSGKCPADEMNELLKIKGRDAFLDKVSYTIDNSH